MKISKLFAGLVLAASLCAGSAFAQSADASGLAGTELAGAQSAAASAGQSSGHSPFFVGGLLGFGSGTGVGTERGLGLRQIEPVIGLWYPGGCFFRAGYGFYSFNSDDLDGESLEVEHSNLDVEIGLQLIGDLYIVGNFSRNKELSDIGDVTWNEWGVGVGSILTMLSRTLLYADIGYRWVLEHFDPFLNKDISGSRFQLNVGFAVFI